MSPHRWHTVSYRLLAALMGASIILIGGFRASPLSAQTSPSTTLTIGWSQDSTNMDPTATISNPNAWVSFEIFDQLLRVGNDGKTLQPDLATNWSSSNGGKVYTFHLRPNVYFTNGARLTAADVAFCLNRARGPKGVWDFLLTAVKNVTAPNPSTVRITLKYPWAPLLYDVSLYGMGVYPEAYFKRVGSSGLAAHPVGTGPYYISSWKHGNELTLTKNPRYWAASTYPMQHIQFQVIPNDTTRLLKVESGQLDVDNVLPTSLIAQAQHNSAVHVQVLPSTLVKYLKGNEKLPQFQDVHVRQAISHAIDRAALVKAVLHGYGTPANSFIPRGAIDWDPNIPVPAYNLSLAKSLMKESKYPNGFTMPYEVQAGDEEANIVATIVQAELAPLGIKLQIKPTDPTTLQSIEQAGKFHFMYTLWTNDIPDPDELTSFTALYSNSEDFFTWYNNPTVNNLVQRAERVTNPAIRKQLYFQIQQIWSQQQWIMALYDEPFINAVSTKVTGFRQNPLGYFVLQGVHVA